MVQSRSAHLAGIGSALSMIAPVAATMAWIGRWDLRLLGFVALFSIPFYFLARSRVLLETEHPGWRRAQAAELELAPIPNSLHMR
jgi:hypothetical protein